jgi:Ca-activated chloride channel family protein
LLSFSFLSSAQYYLKGEIKDEGGRPLANVSILHAASGYVFFSGSTGGFGITTSKKTDTLTFSLDGFQRISKPIDASGYSTIILKKATGQKKSGGFKLASLTKDLERETQRRWFAGDETYASTVENGFIPADKYPSTGLTLNVDRASYSNIRRFLTMKQMVPPDAVRVEEMLNYFNFDYTEPKGDNTFEISSTVTTCPWNAEAQLVFATVKSKKVPLDALPPSHLVFLIDVSGSMDMQNRLPLLKAGFRGLVNNLREIDTVSIVVYGGLTGVLLNATGGAHKQKIFNVIDSLQPGGSTPGESGVKLAYSVARNHFIKDGNNRVILATDGDFNVGVRSETELEELIVAQRESGIYLTCLGVGMGNYKDSKIQALAQKGNGNFAYIDNYAEAEKVLLKEFTQTLYTVADDVYLNVAFNPEYVKEYRLLGFDNKVGAIKDTAATIEGGEVGSAYSMVAAFEVLPTQKGKEEAARKSLFNPVRFSLNYQNSGTAQRKELTEKPSLNFTALKEAPRSYQFAASVLMFGLLLKESKFIKPGLWSEVLSLASASADLQNPSQAEFITLVQQAKTLYSKKRKKGD